METPDVPQPPGDNPTTDAEPLSPVEIPTLKSLFVELRYGETVLGNATAFLAANDRESHCALITNRHVVTGRHQDTGECLHSMGGIPDNIVIHFHKQGPQLGEWKPITLPLYRPDGTPYWIEHPRLGAAADVVGLNLTWANDVRKLPYYMKLDLDRMNMLVGPAEAVSVIGFPFGLSSSGKYPVWATGFLAQELSLVTPDNPVFLIDCRTRPGQSGSAVIAFRPGGYRKHHEGRVSTSLSAQRAWEFLGIYSSRVNADSDLGKVWHVSAVEAVLAAAAADMAARTQSVQKTSSP
jgi:hypothetical protein